MCSFACWYDRRCFFVELSSTGKQNSKYWGIRDEQNQASGIWTDWQAWKCSTTALWLHFSYLTWQMWKDESKRFTKIHHLFYAHTHTHTSTKNSVQVLKATAWKWNCTSSADLKLHIQYPTHSRQNRHRRNNDLTVHETSSYIQSLRPKHHPQHWKICVFFTSLWRQLISTFYSLSWKCLADP